MHNQTLRKCALALTFWLALHLAPLKAQTLPFLETSSTGTFGVDTNGLVYATGTLGTGTVGLSGIGTRMFWYPGKAAFRAGTLSIFDNSQMAWNDANIGEYSTAFGCNTLASGEGSFAAGELSSAVQSGDVALGYGSYASGPDAFAGGGGIATAYCATAFGFSWATGQGAAAFGINSTASGAYSLASGIESKATGVGSVALGEGSTASGSYSTASGWYTTASAGYSTAIGSFNVGGGNPTAWVPTDPLFEVGNGQPNADDTAYVASDALVVYKNGNATFQGVVTAAPGGDIPMYNPNGN